MTNIFLIDDDLDDQLFFKDALHSINPSLQCDYSENGKIAIDKLKNSNSLPDIIFLDLNMPVMNGLEFLTHIKNEKLAKGIPIGIFTTSNSLADIEKTKALGAKFFFTKPSNFNELCLKIIKILNEDFNDQKLMLI